MGGRVPKNICMLLGRQTVQIGVSKNRGTPKSSILIGFSTINHPFWGFSPIFGNIQLIFGCVFACRVFPPFDPCNVTLPVSCRERVEEQQLLPVWGPSCLEYRKKNCRMMLKIDITTVGGGFKHFLFSSLFGEDSHLD